MLLLLIISLTTTYCAKLMLYYVTKQRWLKTGKSKFIVMSKRISNRIFIVLWIFGVFYIISTEGASVNDFIGDNNLGVSNKIVFLVLAMLIGIIIDILIIKGGTLKSLGKNNELEYNNIGSYEGGAEDIILAMDSLAFVLQKIESEVDEAKMKIGKYGLEKEITKLLISSFKLYFEESGKDVCLVKKTYLSPKIFTKEVQGILKKENVYTEHHKDSTITVIKAYSGYYIFKYQKGSIYHYDWQNIHIIQNFCIMIGLIVANELK